MNIAKAIIPSPAQQQKVKSWFKSRDYSSIATWTVKKYVAELDARLNLYDHALNVCGLCHNDIRWRKISTTTTPELCTLTRTQNALETSGLSWVKSDYLPQRHQLSKALTPLLSELHDQASPTDIKKHSEKRQIELKRAEYLCPLNQGGLQTMLSMDLGNFTDKELLNQLQVLLPSIRTELAIPEPQNALKTRKLQSLKSFLNHKAIEYLELLIYCCIQARTDTPIHAPYSPWRLTDGFIAKLLDPYELDAEHIKQWRKDFYSTKLLNLDYMSTFSTEIKSNDKHLSLRLDSLSQ